MPLLYNLLIIIWKIRWPVSETTHTISCFIFFLYQLIKPHSVPPALCDHMYCVLINTVKLTLSCLTQAVLIKSLFCDRNAVLQNKYTGKRQQLCDKMLSFVLDCDWCGYQCLC